MCYNPGAPQVSIALLDHTPPTPLAADNLLGHLLFGVSVHTLRVSDLFVAGRPILRDGRFADIDEEAIYAHAREQAKALWERIALGSRIHTARCVNLVCRLDLAQLPVSTI